MKGGAAMMRLTTDDEPNFVERWRSRAQIEQCWRNMRHERQRRLRNMIVGVVGWIALLIAFALVFEWLVDNNHPAVAAGVAIFVGARQLRIWDWTWAQREGKGNR